MKKCGLIGVNNGENGVIIFVATFFGHKKAVCAVMLKNIIKHE